MATNKIVSDKACQEAINSFTQYNRAIIYDVEVDDDFYAYWNSCYEEEQYAGRQLPNRVKLIKLVLQNEAFKQTVRSLAEQIIDGLDDQFDVVASEYNDEEERQRQAQEIEKEMERERVRREAVKAKVLATLSTEQREALGEAYNISI